MTFKLPDLPYDFSGLEPHISARTLEFHYGKHHQTYVNNLNKLTQDTALAAQTLEEVIKNVAGDNSKIGVFNNAAQVWNHTFYWHCMTPNSSGQPDGELMAIIVADFGSFDNFKQEFAQAAITQFGSGWAWLVLDNNHLKIMKTGNADLPMAHGKPALLTCDVWEHAYYLDYQNRRPDYLNTFLDKLGDWNFVAENLAKYG